MPKLTEPKMDATGTKPSAKSIGMGDLFLTMIFMGGEAILQELKTEGREINVTDTLGRTLLMLAIDYAATCRGKQKQKILATISALLTHGADPNVADEKGDTALSRALNLRQKAIAKLLLEHAAMSPSQIN